MAIKRWMRSRIRLGIIVLPIVFIFFCSCLILFLDIFFSAPAYHKNEAFEYVGIGIMAILTLLSIYLFYFCIKTYRKDIFPKDKLLYKQGVWKLLKSWFYE